jgi:regulator of RNase E activity RraA
MLRPKGKDRVPEISLATSPQIKVLDPSLNFKNYGGKVAVRIPPKMMVPVGPRPHNQHLIDLPCAVQFSGPVSTVKAYESNPAVKKAFEEPGKGRVLVVDAGASMRCAMLGDMIAEKGITRDHHPRDLTNQQFLPLRPPLSSPLPHFPKITFDMIMSGTTDKNARSTCTICVEQVASFAAAFFVAWEGDQGSSRGDGTTSIYITSRFFLSPLVCSGVKNGWAGIIMYGCIRDSRAIKDMPIGVKALNTHPVKSHKRLEGERDVDVMFGGVTISPGDHIYADEDGIVVSPTPIE